MLETMHEPIKSPGGLTRRPNRNYWTLDLARAAAALVVVAEHARSFIFVDASQAPPLNSAWKIFYFFTGLGHPAVMVFFVLSGFLVGGHVIAAVRDEKWSWPLYFFKRLSRLWIVLLPALLLTALWDQIGIDLTHSKLYSGEMSALYHSTPMGNGLIDRYSLSALFLNAFFMQGISFPFWGEAPTFGTNGPLWSLSYEFWYYIIFPLLFIPAFDRSLTTQSRAILILIGVALCIILPMNLVLYGLIWLLGAALYFIHDRVAIPRAGLIALFVIGLLFSGAMLVYARVNQVTFGIDFLLGAAFLLLIGSAMCLENNARPIVAAISHMMASFSYTVYLIHFPFLALLSCVALDNQRLLPSQGAFVIFLAAFVLAVGYSYLVSLLTEAKTSRIQRLILTAVRNRTAFRSEANNLGRQR